MTVIPDGPKGRSGIAQLSGVCDDPGSPLRCGRDDNLICAFADGVLPRLRCRATKPAMRTALYTCPRWRDGFA